MRASTYLPALPEDANEVLAGEQAPLEDLHERQFQLLQEQLSLDDDNSPLRSNAPTSSQLPARLASDSSATPLVPSGSQNSSASLPLTTPRTARNELSLFPAVHCDQALVTATSANALKLNKENLRKTQLSRAAEPSSAVFGPTHPAYMPANTRSVFQTFVVLAPCFAELIFLSLLFSARESVAFVFVRLLCVPNTEKYAGE